VNTAFRFRAEKEEEVGKKLYVGNLPYEVTNSQLEELFAKAGTVTSADVIVDKFSGRSKGFAFIEMSTDEEAAKAVEMYTDYEFDGRKMVVNEARPKPDYRARDTGGYGYNPGAWDRGSEKGSGRRDRRKKERGRRR
jgi:RNA recognition motif-containing protein